MMGKTDRIFERSYLITASTEIVVSIPLTCILYRLVTWMKLEFIRILLHVLFRSPSYELKKIIHSYIPNTNPTTLKWPLRMRKRTFPVFSSTPVYVLQYFLTVWIDTVLENKRDIAYFHRRLKEWDVERGTIWGRRKWRWRKFICGFEMFHGSTIVNSNCYTSSVKCRV